MAAGYTDTPKNWSQLEPYVLVKKNRITDEIIRKKKCFFYDTCSFRVHANLGIEDAAHILEYVKMQGGIFVITRCILMELASHSGVLNPEYIQYIKNIYQFGIPVLVMYEEGIFDVMEVCFSTNAVINSYLIWAVRMFKGPVSTITEILNQNDTLCDEVIKAKNPENRAMYRNFFSAVRDNKEAGDNLGEELLAICLHILSHIPGEEDGKFCIITDDKGAAGKIDTLFKKTINQFKGKSIIIFSTPKLAQVLYAEKLLVNKEDVLAILKAGSNGNLLVLGTRNFDLRVNEIRITCDKLAELIMQPNGINVIF